MNRKLVGVILAGGQSSRMGSNKALLKYNDRLWIDIAEDTLKNTGVDQVLVSGTYAGYLCVPDLISHKGPLVAFYSVVEWVIYQLGFVDLIFLPVDMPFVTPECLKRLTDPAPFFDATIFTGFNLPLFLHLNPDCIMVLNKLFSKIKMGLSGSITELLAGLQVLELPLPAGSDLVFKNINTPEEWKDIRDESKTRRSKTCF